MNDENSFILEPESPPCVAIMFDRRASFRKPVERRYSNLTPDRAPSPLLGSPPSPRAVPLSFYRRNRVSTNKRSVTVFGLPTKACPSWPPTDVSSNSSEDLYQLLSDEEPSEEDEEVYACIDRRRRISNFSQDWSADHPSRADSPEVEPPRSPQPLCSPNGLRPRAIRRKAERERRRVPVVAASTHSTNASGDVVATDDRRVSAGASGAHGNVGGNAMAVTERRAEVPCTAEEGGPAESNSTRETKVFKRVLRDPALRKPFHAFLEQQFCAENLNFYVAVEQFRDMSYQMPTKAWVNERAAAARRIYDRHFTPNSMEPVNVDNATSKRIRDLILSERYLRTTFDVAQYQIFHLLKYDCWPRFIRAGGVAPEFTDEELAEEEPGPQNHTDFYDEEEEAAEAALASSVPSISVNEDDCVFAEPSCPRASSSTSAAVEVTKPEKGGGKNWASNAFSALVSSPSTSHSSKADKRRSLLWHGIDRFSRRLKRGEGSGTRSSGGAGSPVCEPRRGVARTSSTRGSDEGTGEPRRSYSSEMEQEVPKSMERCTLSSAGARRRQFNASGKQFSMPAEMTHPTERCTASPGTSVSPNRAYSQTKYCTLVGDNMQSEVLELKDPSISVGRWTQEMAAARGIDRKATEAVDASTGSTIDPSRQAMDALQNRHVRLMSVVYFTVEILPPNYSTKNPLSTPSKVLMVRARLALSAGAVLRPLLQKYSIEPNSVQVVFSGTCEAIKPGVTVAHIGPRSLTVMSQQQFTERLNSSKKDAGRDVLATSPNLAEFHNLTFHQHGDIAFCELPTEGDKSGRHSAKSEHTLGLMKLLRKAGEAVTSRDDASCPPGSKSDAARRKSFGLSATTGFVYCGEEVPTTPEPKEKEQPIKSKRLSIFRNNKKDKEKEKEQMACSAPSTSYAAQAAAAATSTAPTPKSASMQSPRPSTSAPTKTAEPAPTGQQPAPTSSSSSGANGDAPRTPAIYASKVCSDSDESVSEAERSVGWQAALV